MTTWRIGVYLGSQSQGNVHRDGEGMAAGAGAAGHIMSTARKQSEINAGFQLTVVQFQIPGHRIVLPRVRVDLPNSVSSRNSSETGHRFVSMVIVKPDQVHIKHTHK